MKRFLGELMKNAPKKAELHEKRYINIIIQLYSIYSKSVKLDFFFFFALNPI